mmetsp:Transcript_43005/g.112976  ORF Transcript_43005/g.112976 Transcript_43005/m.112976 type:complete len:81 (-) Transcript_43005:4-246(-)
MAVLGSMHFGIVAICSSVRLAKKLFDTLMTVIRSGTQAEDRLITCLRCKPKAAWLASSSFVHAIGGFTVPGESRVVLPAM